MRNKVVIQSNAVAMANFDQVNEHFLMPGITGF